MAFLQLKKQHHSNKPLKIRLDQSPKDVVGEKNNFDNLEFRIMATNIGESYFAAPYGDRDPFEINTDQSFEFVMSEVLFSKINDYQKNECIYVEMVNNGEKMFWKVEPTSVDPKVVKDLTPGNNDRSLDIKWGMAFNNATRLVANISDITPNQKVLLVEEIMPKMFRIACLMETSIQKEKDDDEKVPF